MEYLKLCGIYVKGAWETHAHFFQIALNMSLIYLIAGFN